MPKIRGIPQPPPEPPSAPGWYPDLANALRQRYWDGSEWTDQFRLAPKGSPSTPAPSLSRTDACPDCGGMVSQRAATCPHCGAPVAEPSSRPVSNPPPGMYPDPEEPGRSRFWDGSSWATPEPERGALGSLEPQLQSTIRVSYLLVLGAVLAGGVAAVTATRASAEGGVIWTGGALVALGLLYQASRMRSAAVKASRAASALDPSVKPRRMLPFVGVVLLSVAAVAAAAGVTLAIELSQSPDTAGLQVGDCVDESAGGSLAEIPCTDAAAEWRVTNLVQDAASCPADYAFDFNATLPYACLSPA